MPPGPFTAQLPVPAVPPPHVPAYRTVPDHVRASSLERCSNVSRAPALSGAGQVSQQRTGWVPSKSPELRTFHKNPTTTITPALSPIHAVTSSPGSPAKEAAQGAATLQTVGGVVPKLPASPIVPIINFGFPTTVGNPADPEIIQVRPPSSGAQTPVPGSPVGDSLVTNQGLLQTKSGVHAKTRPDSPAASSSAFGALVEKAPPPRLPSPQPLQSPPRNPKAQAIIDVTVRNLELQKIPIPQYKFEKYVDWATLGRYDYDVEKIEAAFNFRFRGCKGWTMPSDNRSQMAKGWQTILDKVANVFGKSDTYPR